MKKRNQKPKEDTLEDYSFFATPLYKISKPEFHDELVEISQHIMELTKKRSQRSNNNLCHMSENLLQDERIAPFVEYILATSYNILDSQGYDLSYHDIKVSSIWLQEHHKHSEMRQHIHNLHTQLVAFYFLDVDKDGCRLVIHDPRPAKVITDLPLKDPVQITTGSSEVFITPEEGDLLFTNSYTPHSYSRNMSDNPTNFLHINITVQEKTEQPICTIPQQTGSRLNDGPEII
jgi:hypothetical protein